MSIQEKLQEMANDRIRQLEQAQKQAVGRWSDLISVVESHYKEKDQIMPLHQKYNIARCCDNLLDHYLARGANGVINEASSSSAISYVAQFGLAA